MCRDLPNEDTEASIEGTKAHEMAAHMLNGEAWLAVDSIEEGAVMFSHVKAYTDDIQRRADGKILLVEQKVLVAPWTGEKDGFGTADAIIFDETTGHLEVRDLKYGMVVLVHAEENEQLMLYALGAKHLVETFGYEVKSVTVAIHQPRRDHYDEWSVSIEKLLEFGAYARSRGTIALSAMPGEELHPDPHGCEWCPAKTFCKAYEEAVHKIVFDEFTEINGVPTAVARPVEGEVTPGELDMVEAWVSAKRKWIFEQLNAGVPLQSWKLVEGRAGNRKFSDEEAVEALLRKMRFKVSEFTEKSMLPLTKIEKLVGKERWQQLVKYVKQNPGQAQMTPMSDKRPVFQTASIDDFDDLTRISAPLE